MSSKKNLYKKADRFTEAAKATGYPARSVFKLSEIDRRVRLFRQGQRVLDLGAAPGSWTKLAAERVGGKGRVIAVDLSPITAVLPQYVTTIVGDVFAMELDVLGQAGPYDVVISDMAPATTGTRFADQARSAELYGRALAVATALLRPGGAFVGKIFMGEEFPAAAAATKAAFTEQRTIRPEATRTASYEVFLVGLGFRPKEGETKPG